MKRILLVSGHTAADTRGCLYGGEGKLNIELVNMIAPNLSPYCNLTIYPAERDLYKDLKNNCCKVDLAVFDYVFEVHFNASNTHTGRGTGIHIHEDYTGGISVEQAIVDNVAAFGFKKRGNNGIVHDNDLLIMNTCFKKGIDHALLETCFGDNSADMAIYQANKSAIAKAIADGMINAFGLTLTNKVSRTGIVVSCSTLNVRATPNGTVTATIKRGTTVEIAGEGKDSDGDIWYLINASGLTGYVWPKYINVV